MKNLFNSIQLKRPKNNVFDLSHDVKLSADMGVLTPIMTMECVPGDKVNIAAESLIRFAPMIAPVMHRMDVTMHYFFVPNRILWGGWEKFITNDPNAETVPRLTLQYTDPKTVTKLGDYLGVPPLNQSNSMEVSALPFAAYQKIYDEFYRDQNLIQSDFNLGEPYLNSGNNDFQKAALTSLRRRAWEHDYFTAALPFAQKGAPVSIPIGNIQADFPIYVNNGGTDISLQGNPNNIDVIGQSAQFGGIQPDELYAEANASVQPTTINDLRRAFKLQEWLEKNARGGTRYVENILSHFGVKSPDKRLQRPEYITGCKSPVIVSEVLNTTGQTDGLPQGNMAGHGIAVTTGHKGSYYCEEHGYIIGIMSVMPKTAYQQGVPRTFLKQDYLDYFWPTFANIGEQEVSGDEIWAGSGGQIFGYVPRYSEYKYLPSRVAGDFRDTLDYWHLGRIFSQEPTLSKEFIECTPSKRIFAVTDPNQDSLYCHVLNKVQAIRPMPKFGTPMF